MAQKIKEAPQNPSISGRITTEMYEALEEYCREQGITRSIALRLALIGLLGCTNEEPIRQKEKL